MAITDQHIRNIFIYVMPKFFSYSINLIALPILTRLLAPREFGVIALAWMFPSVAVSVLSCGLSTAAQRYYFEYRDDAKKLFSFIFSVQVFLYLMFVVSSFVVFFLRGSISKLVMGDSSFGLAVFVTFMASFLGNIATFYFNLYQNMEKATTYSIFMILQSSITVISGVLFVWYFKMSYMGILYGFLLGSGAVCLMMMIYFNRNMKFIFGGRELWENIKYGLQVVPKAFTGFVTKFFDKYMLNSMLSLSVVGVYNIGQTIGNAMFFLIGKVWAAFQPVYYGEVFQKGDQASSYVGRLFTKFAYIALTLVLLLILFAQELIYILAPSSYYPAINVIIILAIGVSTQIFGMYSSVQYAYSKKAYWIFPITVIGTLVNVVTNIILIPKFGLLGAAIATAVFYFFINGLLAFIGQKVYKIGYEWKIIISLYSIVILSTGLILYARFAQSGNIWLYFVKLGAISSFIYAGIKAKIITKHSVRKIRDSLIGFLPTKGAA